MLQAARAWAFLEDRDLVLPEDLQAILPATIGHRLQTSGEKISISGDGLVKDLLSKIPLP
jgi:MoxR-like ATPase